MSNLIILDSGHAQRVQGKEAPDKSFREWDFNNQMQYKIKKRCEEHGISVYLTNPSPANMDEMGLIKRTQLANGYWDGKGKPKALFISIHANAHLGVFTSARGTETYIASNASQNSKNASSYVQQELVNTIKSIDSKALDRGVKTSNFTVIYNTAMPSILIEYAFYTNREDLAILKNNKDELTEATVRAICKYFSIPYKIPVATIKADEIVSYMVVTGSYLYKKVAQRQINKLKEIGIEASIDEVKQDYKTYYKVIVGPYSTKNEARNQVDVLKKKGFASIIL